MKPEIITRAATEGDYDPLFAVHEKLFRHHIEQIWGWQEEWQRQNSLKEWKECDTEVVDAGGELLGYVQTLQALDHIYLKNIGLLPFCQGRGIGTDLVRALQGRAAASGRPLRLSVFVTNPRAGRFYERLGFLPEESSAEFQHMIWYPAKGAVV